MQNQKPQQHRFGEDQERYRGESEYFGRGSQMGSQGGSQRCPQQGGYSGQRSYGLLLGQGYCEQGGYGSQSGAAGIKSKKES